MILVNVFNFVLRFLIGPVALMVVSFDESSDPEIPEESYPLYSSFISPWYNLFLMLLVEAIPNIPHIIFSLQLYLFWLSNF